MLSRNFVKSSVVMKKQVRNPLSLLLPLLLASVPYPLFAEIFPANGGGGCAGNCASCIEQSNKIVPPFPYTVLDPVIGPIYYSPNKVEPQCVVSPRVWGCFEPDKSDPKGYKITGAYIGSHLCASTLIPVYSKFGAPKKPDCTGNPINISIENKYQKEVDSVGHGAFPLNFERHYNSRQPMTGTALGEKWRGTFDASIVGPFLVFPTSTTSIPTAYVHRPDGKSFVFRQKDGVWTGDSFVGEKLEEISDDAGERVGWRLHTKEDRVETYDVAGKLTLITDARGNTHTLYYDDADRLDRVESNQGEWIEFTYDVDDMLQSITNQAERTWSYRYGNGGNLKFVDNPDNRTRAYLYHYDNPNAGLVLVGIRDGDETEPVYASWAYDKLGRPISSSHADIAQPIEITYNDDGTRTLSNGKGDTTYTVEEINDIPMVTSISGPGCSTCGGANTSYRYDPANNNLLVKTDNGVTTKYGNYFSIDNPGCRVEGVATGDTTTAACGFDPLVSPDARRIDYTYDARFYGKVKTKTEPSVYAGQSKVTTYEYDDYGNRTSVSISGFDMEGKPVSRTTSYRYEGPLHQLSEIDGPRTDVEDVTRYDYYPNDAAEGNNRARLKAVFGADGLALRSAITYTATGKIASEMRRGGLQLDYGYDLSDRLESLTQSVNGFSRTTRWSYRPTGEVETITAAYGTADATQLSFAYDDARRLVQITDGLGNYIHYTLDSEGNETDETIHDSSGKLKKRIDRTFDAYSHLQHQQLGELAQPQIVSDSAYNPNGTLAQLTDGKGRVSDYGYDDLKRLTRITQDLGGSDPDTRDAETQYDYDAQDHLIRVSDPNDGTTRYAYDDLGNLLYQSSPDSGETHLRYDEAGNLVSKSDARGQIFYYSYDLLNRLTLLDAPGVDDDISYHYGSYDGCDNGSGKVCNITLGGEGSAPVSVDYRYNGFGEVIAHQGIGYDYDNAGRLKTLSYPSGAIVTYRYDAAGRVSEVRLKQEGQETVLADQIDYVPIGPVSALRYGNGIALNRALDKAYLTTAISADSALDLGGMQYDRNGNLTERNNAATIERFAYDALDRLDTATGNLGARDYDYDYDYDRNGNRRQLLSDDRLTGYNYEPNSNRLRSVGADNYTLDGDGNTLAKGAWRYGYTAHNRLKSATLEGETKAQYSYNGLGQRSQKSSEADFRQYRYSTSGQLLSEGDGMGNSLREYIYLNGQLLVQLTHGEDSDADGIADAGDNCIKVANPDQRDTNGDGYGNACDTDFNNNGRTDPLDFSLLKSKLGCKNCPEYDLNGNGVVDPYDFSLFKRSFGQGPGPSGINGESNAIGYVHNDHLGTPQAMSNGAGKVVWRASYDPFGAATVDEDVDRDRLRVTLNVRFPGQYFDEETGLHYNYFRDYDPTTGRYLQSDPIGLNGGLNTYAYVGGRPTMRIDPKGLTGFFGGEIQFPFPWPFLGNSAGGGVTVVTCKDECDELRTFVFKKYCGGASQGWQVIVGGVQNMDGKKCRAKSYSGYFFEFAAGIGGVSTGIDIGLTDDNGNYLPDGLSGVNEGGIGPGSSGLGWQICYYIPIDSK